MTAQPDSDVLALARELIRIDTVNPPGAEAAAAERVARFFAGTGVEVEIQRFGRGRANLVARVRGTGGARGLLLSGHLDTVPVGDGPWTVAPLEGVVRDGRLYGRGAVDMKGAVAAMAVALRDLARLGRRPSGDVVLALTAGEEADSCGARLLAGSDLLGDVGMAVIGEPTNLDVGIAHRGVLWVRAEATGEAGHGSQANGANAVRALLRWLAPFETIETLADQARDPVLGGGSVSLNVIGGGHTVNVVPDSAFALLDFRTVPGQGHRAMLDALGRRTPPGVELTVLRDMKPVSTPSAAPVVAAVVDAVAQVTGADAVTRGLPYATDASVFAEALDIPIVVVGPGSELEAHTEDESVEVQALHQAAEIYRRVAQRIAFAHPPTRTPARRSSRT